MSEGRSARELTDEELEHQGTHAHATRNWVFLHGTADQYRRHTERMLELEQEYLRRYPKRTWQGAGGADGDAPQDEVTRLRQALRSIGRQIEVLLDEAPGPAGTAPPPVPVADRERALLARVAAAGGRLHKLEAHQAAREAGLDQTALARLYRAQPPLLVTDKQDRVLTEAGRALLG